MEFNFVDSRSAWTYDAPDHVVEEVLTARKPEKGMLAISAASIKFEPFRDEYLPNLPPALWLMDTGCGHDLVNDKMADDFPVKTLKKVSELCSPRQMDVSSHEMWCPFIAKNWHNLFILIYCTTRLQSFRLASDAWSKDSHFTGRLAESRS